VRVSLRNALPTALWVRGFQDRAPGTLDSIPIAPSTTHEFRFVAVTPGARYYWGGGAKASVPTSNADGQLVGALVVDPPSNAGSQPVSDRVMVLTRWTPTGKPENQGFQLNAFNGRSWPNTERLTYTVNDSVFWHVINASDATHEMHLHGFYFRTDARGFAIDTAGASRAGIGGMRVTGVLRPGEWYSIAWSPDRPGNWLYHCHLLTHMSGDQRLDRMPGATAAKAADGHEHGAGANHALDDMGGLVLGLDVRPSGAATTAMSNTAPLQPHRSIDVFANTRAHRFGDGQGYGFVVQEGSSPPAQDSIRIPGTPLILTKGEPVQIAVHNRLPHPISVHWHGIELESYFDGVAGFAGQGKRIAPVIAPRDSFEARFTPPRSGTFIYHPHADEVRQQKAGLSGALLVVDSPASFNPANDLVFLLTVPRLQADLNQILINGSMTPPAIEMHVGERYRLRIVDIHTFRPSMIVRMLRDSTPVTWRAVAKDGMDIPSDRATARPAVQQMGNGETYDFEFAPTTTGDLRLTVSSAAGAPLASIPVRVR